MPVVPKYERSVRLDPLIQRGINVQATPEAFGAAAARGLGDIAQGVGQVAQAKVYIDQLEGEAAAKEADNRSAAQIRELTYGENGYLNLEGQAAVQGRAEYEKRVDEIIRTNGADLKGFGGKAYAQASTARMNQTLDTSIRHQSAERKTWMKTSSAERVQTFSDDALAAYDNPKIVAQNIAAGQAEIASISALQGMDAKTISERQSDFASGVHENVAIRMAALDPFAANEYLKAHEGSINGDGLARLEKMLSPVIIEAQARTEAERILNMGRAPVVAPEDVSVGPTIANAGKSAGAYDSAIRSLQGRAVGGATRLDALVGLDKGFVVNLSSLIEDAPPGVREGLGLTSGYRSTEKQTELWNNSDKTGKKVARPGHSSHEHGLAADLTWNGQTIKKGVTPQHVIDYLHQNAAAYGLGFRMDWEPWHIEPTDARARIASGGPTVTAVGTGVSARAAGTSVADQTAALDAITNPLLREETARRLNVLNGQRDAEAKAVREQLNLQAFALVDSGQSPDSMDPMMRAQLGREEMAGLWSYYEARNKPGGVKTDDHTLYYLQSKFAESPERFAQEDLFAYRDSLSDADWDKVNGWRQTALTDQRKASDEASTIISTTDYMKTQLEAVGISTVGLEGPERQAAMRREAEFQLALQREIDTYVQANKKKPDPKETQGMINRLLLPVVVETKGTLWNSEENKLLFEVPKLGDIGGDRMASIYQEFAAIPQADRTAIEMALEQKLGYKPSEEQVEIEYAMFLQSSLSQRP